MFPRCANAYCAKPPRWGSRYCSERCVRDAAMRRARENNRRISEMIAKAMSETGLKKETPTP